MNERIRELITESETEYSTLYEPSYDMEKFAKLIVLECAKVLTQHGTYFSGEGEPYYYAANLIEEHFGVIEDD